jgi:hypothetical protein
MLTRRILIIHTYIRTDDVVIGDFVACRAVPSRVGLALSLSLSPLLAYYYYHYCYIPRYHSLLMDATMTMILHPEPWESLRKCRRVVGYT